MVAGRENGPVGVRGTAGDGVDWCIVASRTPLSPRSRRAPSARRSSRRRGRRPRPHRQPRRQPRRPRPCGPGRGRPRPATARAPPRDRRPVRRRPVARRLARSPASSEPITARAPPDCHHGPVSTQCATTARTFHSRPRHRNCSGPSTPDTRPIRVSTGSSYRLMPAPFASSRHHVLGRPRWTRPGASGGRGRPPRAG